MGATSTAEGSRRTSALATSVPFLVLAAWSATAPTLADEATVYVARQGGAPIRAGVHDGRLLGRIGPGEAAPLRSCATCQQGIYYEVEPRGYVDVRHLVRAPAPPPEGPVRMARVLHTTPVYEGPDAGTRVLRHIRRGFVIAFAEATFPGFALRPNGGFVPTRYLRFIEPSRLSGVRQPTLPLALFVADTPVGGRTARRYESVGAVSVDERGTVTTAQGTVPRASVRLARAHARPSRVPPNGKWIHVDTREQVLVAYEGDRPVFATLVRSGSPVFPTSRGLYRVYQMTRQATMAGDESSYRVERVQHVLFFHNDFALHGAFWHDLFGARGSHGCVNLSPVDAAHLFAWMPSAVPPGWQSVHPLTMGSPTTHVLIDEELDPPATR